MACPDCEATRKQYLAMRRAVLGFARTLNQYEQERLSELDDRRPAGAPSMRELRAAIEGEAGLPLHDKLQVRRVGS
jgi:hypothetical protein